jgi:glycosyltransferase involved in cell wall biosynthesis
VSDVSAHRLGPVTKPADLAPAGPRVALVHDFLLDLRGAERVFAELCEMWPEADIYTAVYDEKATEGRFAHRDVRCSFLQRLRPTAETFRVLLPFYPTAVESLDLSGYDLVVSSSSAWAHGVICHGRTVHVSYCHNPFRYAWNDYAGTLARRHSPLTRAFLRSAFRRWRQWDWIAAQRTSRYIANSRTTQERIRSYFGRESTVVHPPVATSRFSPGPVADYYVIVSELMAHKDLDIAVDAFNSLSLPLVIVGNGPDARRLRRRAGPTIRFTGRLSDTGVAEVLQAARAMVVTSVEEFGISAVECQAAGRPVIARHGGGALETIVDGVTGCFWSGWAADLAAAVLAFDDSAIDPQACVRQAARFDSRSFRRRMHEEVAVALASDRCVGGRQPLSSTRLLQRAVRDSQRR